MVVTTDVVVVEVVANDVVVVVVVAVQCVTKECRCLPFLKVQKEILWEAAHQ